MGITVVLFCLNLLYITVLFVTLLLVRLFLGIAIVKLRRFLRTYKKHGKNKNKTIRICVICQ